MYVTYRAVLVMRHSIVMFTGVATIATWDNRTIPLATEDRKGSGESPLMTINVSFVREGMGVNNH
jgi:hypothetical protein